MRSVKLHSSRKQNTKMPISHQAPLRLPDTLQQSPANAQSCRSYAVKLPPTLRQALPREHSHAESIKAAIHKLRTETPQFSQLGFMHGRSRSYFFERTPKVRKSQERVLQMFTNMRNLQKKETKYFLPGKAVGEQRPTQSHSLPRAQPQQDCNVILLKRNMRYRLQKLPHFDKPLPTSDQQMNMSVTGWHRNPEEPEEFPQRL